MPVGNKNPKYSVLKSCQAHTYSYITWETWYIEEYKKKFMLFSKHIFEIYADRLFFYILMKPFISQWQL